MLFARLPPLSSLLVYIMMLLFTLLIVNTWPFLLFSLLFLLLLANAFFLNMLLFSVDGGGDV